MLKQAAPVAWLRRGLNRAGYDLTQHPRTVNGRRLSLLRHLGVDLVVDVGANRGQYAQQLRFDGYRAGILSIEPASAPFEALAAAAAGDPGWEVVRAGVGAVDDVGTLNVSGRDLFSSFRPLTDMTTRVDGRAAFVRTERVPVRRLDDLLAGRRERRIAVKMDVQGYEREVVRGANDVLSRAVYAEAETGVHPQYEGAMLWTETIDRMTEFGLTLACVENILTEHPTGRALAFNALFVRTSAMPPC